MFLLFDPIFWINKTLATFDRMISKLTKLVEKCENEIASNRDSIDLAYAIKKEKTTVKVDKREAKLAKIKEKVDKKLTKISEKAAKADMVLGYRNHALEIAKKRAANSARNIEKMMGE